MSTTLKIAFITGILALGLVPADQWDKKTIVTIDAPVQLPTATLPAGTYTFKLLDSPSNRHIVTIWDKDGMKHITTILAIPNYRLQPTAESKFTFWETPADQPKAMRAWFYPGDNFGQEFAYPKARAETIAVLAKSEVPTLTESDESRIATETKKVEERPAVVPNIDESSAPPAQVAASQPTPPPPTVAEQPKAVEAPPRAAAEEQQPKTAQADIHALPQTASDRYELALLGLVAAVLGFATYGVRRAA